MATMTSNTSCITETDGFKVVSVCDGSNEMASIMGGTPIAFNFTPQDVASITTSSNGDMMIEFTSGYSATLVGYQDMIAATGQEAILYNDGNVLLVDTLLAFNDQGDVDTLGADDQESFVTVLKPTTGTNSYNLDGDINYATDFTQTDIREAIVNEAGNIVITFNDGTETTLTGYQSAESDSAIPTMTLADGVVVEVSDILGTGNVINFNDTVELAMVPAAPESTLFEIAETLNRVEPAVGLAETLAAIEPAAGEAAGPLQNTGADFGSSIAPGSLDPALAIGPIGETELRFGRPELDEERDPVIQAASTPALPDPIVRAPSLVVNNPIIKEDGSGDLFVEATLQSSFTTETLTVIVSNLDNSWTITTGANNGTYDAATGTWTITMPAGENYTGTLNLAPPADSDVDMNDIRVQAIATQTNGDTSEVEAFVDATVDAVIDQPTLTANDVTGTSGGAYDLNITNVLGDTDGSETFGNVTISGVPSGFSLSAGTETTPGTWSVPQSDLAGLQINTPAGFLGNFDLDVAVTATDNPTDTEVDTTDNDETVNTTITVNLDVQNASQPTIDVPVDNRVYEDNTISVPFTVTLGATALPSEFLTVTVTNIPSTWTVTTGANNGSYDAATGTWTITMRAGQNYNGALSFAPPANSDVDLSNLTFNAVATQPGNGSTSSVTAVSPILVDAVADTPDMDVMAQNTINAGQVLDLNIANALTDTDGSETLGDVTVSGLPNDFSLNAGMKQPNGDWIVPQSQLTGLKVNVPLNAVGNITITASVTATETITDTDFDNTNDTATNSDRVTFTVVQNDQNPDVTFGGTGSNGRGQVSEDGSVFVPITATLNGTTPQVLTVTLTGVPSTWTVQTGANNGTYNASTGTWTITMPQGDNYNGGLTFTPPANSDIDLTGLAITASAQNTVTNNRLESNTSGQIIVDAVADMPNLSASNVSGFDGQTIPLNITAALTDTDGSETLSVVTIAGLPDVLTLNRGTKQPNGDWEVSASDLANLRINAPRDYSGTTNVSVSVTSNEAVLDNEFDLTNNQATNTTTFTIDIADRANPPTLDVAGVHNVSEDGTVFVPFSATTTGSGAEILTVSVAGIPAGWGVTTGANNGTYNPTTREWTITMPQGQNYDGGLTFAPPANSDVDLSNLRVTASSFVTATNTRSSITELTNILVDAIADQPTIDVNATGSVEAGDQIDLNISNALTDTDGSETLGPVTISGLPSGFTLTAGDPQTNGDWIVQQSDLASLKVNIPVNAVGDITITTSVTSTEGVTDNEFDLTNNIATNSDAVTFTVIQNDQAPDVTFAAPGAGNTGEVLEDGSVFVPIAATLNGTTPQVLTVTLTGVPSAWTVNTGANNGTFNAATGTWTITLPQGDNYDGGLTFTPPTNSDVDLSGLTVTASARNTVTNNVTESDVNGRIIVDAVADAPRLELENATVEEGKSVALDIEQTLRDTDGSEILKQLEISGLPAGATLNNGNENGSGVWLLNPSDLVGLRINLPDGSDGTYQLTVKSTSEEQITDEDFNLSNNTASTTAFLNLVVSQDSVPTIITPSSPLSRERDLSTTNTINGRIQADLGNDAVGAEFCIPTGGVFSATGAMGSGQLSSNSVPVAVTMANGNTQYVGKAGSVTVFTLTLEADGDYTFKQYRPLDHASASNPNEIINLNFGVKVVDGDGDLSPLGTLTVRVEDTGPTARNDVVQMSSCDFVTMGNAITNYNQLSSRTDQTSLENAVIEQVSFGGKTYNFADSNAQSMSVDGKYGTLYIFKTGEYTYVSGQANPKSSHTEKFTYTLVDQDGDRSAASIKVTVKEETITSNPLSIYVYDITNTVIDGRDAYQIQNKKGEFILADELDDVLAGNSGSDSIFGWDGDDIIYGMGGNDVLNGEKHNNTLYGGSGADMFKIHGSKASDNHFDTIKDFSLDEGDVIDIQDLLAGYDDSKGIGDFVRLSNNVEGMMLQVNKDGKGNDFRNTALISDHAGLDARSLTIDDLVSGGYLDAY